MTVSVVIPAWNDAHGVQAALSRLIQVSCIAEIIIVDDCSAEPLQGQIDVAAAQAAQKTVKILRHAENKSGGAARNTGLEAVTCPFVIFLDSDDLPTAEYGPLLERFIAYDGAFDFAMFRHIDSREEAQGRACGVPVDERCWDQLPKSDEPQVMSVQQMHMMVAVSAYPWNKLYRTAFLRAHQIQCTEIPVHNDIEIHWASFLMAQRVIYSHTPGLRHFVSAGGARITNRRDADRLRVFEALNNVQNRMESGRFCVGINLAFWQFYTKLMRWIPQNLDPGFEREFKTKCAKFILRHVSPKDFRVIALEDPGLSSDLLGHLKDDV